LGEDVPLAPSSLSVPPMSEVTRILSAMEHGEPHAGRKLRRQTKFQERKIPWLMKRENS
jgi:hypothetical protein